MSLEKEIKEFKIILKNTKKESNPNPFEQRLLRKVIKLIQELQTAKEENEKLKEQYKWYDHYKDSALGHTKLINEKYIPQIETLTQQNKQMRDFLSSLDKCPSDECNVDCLNQAIDRNCLYANIKQTLKEVNNEK